MAIYTFDEIEKLILSAIPGEAEPEIVQRALNKILSTSLRGCSVDQLAKNFACLSPHGSSVSQVAESMCDALATISLSHVKQGNIIPGMKVVVQQMFSSYVASIAYFNLDFPEWNSKHRAEINNIIDGSIGADVIPDTLRDVLKELLIVKKEDLKNAK
jgi:hypothetical protein